MRSRWTFFSYSKTKDLLFFPSKKIWLPHPFSSCKSWLFSNEVKKKTKFLQLERWRFNKTVFWFSFLKTPTIHWSLSKILKFPNCKLYEQKLLLLFGIYIYVYIGCVIQQVFSWKNPHCVTFMWFHGFNMIIIVDCFCIWVTGNTWHPSMICCFASAEIHV